MFHGSFQGKVFSPNSPLKHIFVQFNVLNRGWICPPEENRQCLEIFLVVLTNSVDRALLASARSSDTAKHPTAPRTAPSRTPYVPQNKTKNCPHQKLRVRRNWAQCFSVGAVPPPCGNSGNSWGASVLPWLSPCPAVYRKLHIEELFYNSNSSKFHS